MAQLVLASASERRQALIKNISKDVLIVPSTLDESKLPILEPEIYATVLAYLKANNVLTKYKDKIILGADTLVSLNDEILGKPEDRETAKRYLQKLSGLKHRVITGVAILSRNKKVVETEVSYVKFRPLSNHEIELYLDTEEYCDKAGAYAIQGKGKDLIEYYEGDINNIIGLPVERIKKILKEFSYYYGDE